MANNFGIPTEEMRRIVTRDKKCAYCSKVLIYPYDSMNRRDSATIEHLDFDGPFYWRDGLEAKNIVMACGSCNSSRGQKTLRSWLESEYCAKRSITIDTVSPAVAVYIEENPNK